MAFTYDLGASDESVLAISKVRFELNDVVENQGARPNNMNFTDEEIALLLSEEDNDINRAAARACNILSRAWTIVANESVGQYKVQYQEVSKQWASQAADLATKSGTVQQVIVSKVQRSDPYQRESTSE